MDIVSPLHAQAQYKCDYKPNQQNDWRVMGTIIPNKWGSLLQKAGLEQSCHLVFQLLNGFLYLSYRWVFIIRNDF